MCNGFLLSENLTSDLIMRRLLNITSKMYRLKYVTSQERVPTFSSDKKFISQKKILSHKSSVKSFSSLCQIFSKKYELMIK